MSMTLPEFIDRKRASISTLMLDSLDQLADHARAEPGETAGNVTGELHVFGYTTIVTVAIKAQTRDAFEGDDHD